MSANVKAELATYVDRMAVTWKLSGHQKALAREILDRAAASPSELEKTRAEVLGKSDPVSVVVNTGVSGLVLAADGDPDPFGNDPLREMRESAKEEAARRETAGDSVGAKMVRDMLKSAEEEYEARQDRLAVRR